MQTVVKGAVVGLGLLAGTTAAGHAQYYNYYGTPSYNYYGTPNYNYYGTPNTYSWSPQNYPGYQTSYSANPWYYYYPG